MQKGLQDVMCEAFTSTVQCPESTPSSFPEDSKTSGHDKVYNESLTAILRLYSPILQRRFSCLERQYFYSAGNHFHLMYFSIEPFCAGPFCNHCNASISTDIEGFSNT